MSGETRREEDETIPSQIGKQNNKTKPPLLHH